MKKTKKGKQKGLFIKRCRKVVKRKIRAGQNPYTFRYKLINGVLKPFGAKRRDY